MPTIGMIGSSALGLSVSNGAMNETSAVIVGRSCRRSGLTLTSKEFRTITAEGFITGWVTLFSSVAGEVVVGLKSFSKTFGGLFSFCCTVKKFPGFVSALRGFLDCDRLATRVFFL